MGQSLGIVSSSSQVEQPQVQSPTPPQPSQSSVDPPVESPVDPSVDPPVKSPVDPPADPVELNATKKYRIVQIGCGVVGKAYVNAYKNVGCDVIGIEASQKLVDLYKDEMTIYHVSDDMSNIKDIDFIMISICTPLKEDKLDLSYLFSSIKNVAVIVKNSPNAYVIIRSTVPPTTTHRYKKELEEVLGGPAVRNCEHNSESGGIPMGQKVNVLFQPEFLRAVSAVEDALHPWHILFGVDNGTDVTLLLDLYTRFLPMDDITVTTIENAEFHKICHNCINAAKISITNQFHLLGQAINEKEGTNISIENIMKTLVKTCEGLKNPRYGTKPGHAYYGTCLPKDSAELASLEHKYGLSVPLFDCVVKVNNEIKKTDKEEVLNGDYHISFDKLKN